MNGGGLNEYYGTTSARAVSIRPYIITTQATLETNERRNFSNKKDYLFKQIIRIENNNVPLSNKLRLENFGHVANISMYLQRSDVTNATSTTTTRSSHTLASARTVCRIRARNPNITISETRGTCVRASATRRPTTICSGRRASTCCRTRSTYWTILRSILREEQRNH